MQDAEAPALSERGWGKLLLALAKKRAEEDDEDEE
jgi:hypothetical protein